MSEENHLKIVQLNICRGKHPQAMEFIKANRDKFDAFLLQEVVEHNQIQLARDFRNAYFVPMTKAWDGISETQGRWTTSGVGIYTNLPMTSVAAHYYVGEYGRLQHLDDTSLECIDATKSRVVAVCDIAIGSIGYRLATTHFTWVPKGEPSDFQRADVWRMAQILNGLGEFVFCGDFNFPRGGEIYQKLLALTSLHAAVPARFDNTLDPELHKLNGKVKAMIDHIFVGVVGYEVYDVEQVFGLSDHGAFTAKVRERVGSMP